MKRHLKWIVPALALVIVLGGSAWLYPKLSERFVSEPETTAAADVEATTEETGSIEEPASQEEPASVKARTESEPASRPQTAPDAELAADFVVYDKDNAEVRLSDHFGKPLVVNFWASWCGPCRSELPAFDAAAIAHAGEIEFMMVNLTDGYSETVDSVQEFIADSGYTFPVYFDTDGNASRTYSIYSIPLTVFIRADGTVMDSHIGSMDEDTLQSYLARLAN